MNKEMVKAQHKAHLRLFLANIGNVVAARFGRRPPIAANDRAPADQVATAGNGAVMARSIA